MDMDTRPEGELQPLPRTPQTELLPPGRRNLRARRTVVLVLFGAAIVVGVVAALVREGGDADKSNLIRLETPLRDAVVRSPLVVRGEARGTWFFEASFPVRILDGNGNELGVVPAQAQGEWMTEAFVPFEATLTFTPPTTDTGTLILEKDNPSGLPEHADELRIPVRFSPSAGSGGRSGAEGGMMMRVTAYFGNTKLNPRAEDCSVVYPVARTVPKTVAVGRASLSALLEGPTGEEKGQGFTTSVNPGVKIQSLRIENGVARVDFSAELEKSVGGSCRVQAIRSQITNTLLQFPTVRSVVISVDGRTEDILQP
ncbi:MAG: GerMN domain-containing protein [Candidatus Liptonbacteria bacterium]|nr:GerMN domain-containing protein [Candidatus Liptonbacteria bacterium]